MSNTTNADLPNYVRAEAVAFADDLALMDDLLAGTRRMWAESKERNYIRKWIDEQPAVYDIRRQIETLFGGLSRTLSAAVGMLFAKPPAITWNQGEALMAPHLDNIDMAGTKLDIFAKRFSEASVRDGLALILVDHPKRPDNVVITAANEESLGLRPIWSRYDRRHVLNWNVGRINNRTELTLLVLSELASVPTGRFGSATRQRYRVLELLPGLAGSYFAQWTLFEQQGDAAATEFTIIGTGIFRNRNGEVAQRIPVGIAYTGRTDEPLVAQLPLLDVAWANLAHWQMSTNLRFNREVCGFEQLVVQGDIKQQQNADGTPGQGKLAIGPLVAINVEAGGDVNWRGPSGAGLAQLESGVQEKLQQMAQLGVTFLSSDTRAAETAQAKRIDATAENATLATAGQGVEDALNMALEWHAWYLGIAKAGAPVIALNRDFEAIGPDASLLTAFAALAREGFPKRPLLESAQRMGVIGPDDNIDDLWDEWTSAEQAAQDQAALAAAAQADAMRPGAPP